MKSPSIHYRLRDYKETFKFEREHPKELRWDDRYKLYQLTEAENVQGIWMKDGNTVIGEAILSWESKNVIRIDSFTILPEHRGKGLGYILIKAAIDWAAQSEYEWLIGEARKGPSWHIFENFGATPIFSYKDWNGTKEEYMFFKLEL